MVPLHKNSSFSNYLPCTSRFVALYNRVASKSKTWLLYNSNPIRHSTTLTGKSFSCRLHIWFDSNSAADLRKRLLVFDLRIHEGFIYLAYCTVLEKIASSHYYGGRKPGQNLREFHDNLADWWQRFMLGYALLVLFVWNTMWFYCIMYSFQNKTWHFS